MKIKADYSNAPQWKELTVKATLPEQLKCLDEIAHNMWWVWNYEARDLFRDLDPELYHDVKHNPVMLLERLSFTRKEEILKDKALMKRIKNVCDLFHQYMDVKPDSKRPSVAYFCMEYGIHSALKIYSGGLGMLAGDYVKEASDSNVDMCAVGFLYRFGYFTQSLSMDGQQIANYETQNFSSLPIERQLDKDGNPMVVDVPYTNYQVHAYVWRVNVGRVKLYLLDTDNEMNSDFDKPITHALYGGDWENRLKQEILLGIGGMLLLKKLGIKKDIYHCNEGHAALCNLQRLCDYIEEDGLTFNQAMELVRASSLYTVHTPVPAGHDYFDEGEILHVNLCLQHLPGGQWCVNVARMGIAEDVCPHLERLLSRGEPCGLRHQRRSLPHLVCYRVASCLCQILRREAHERPVERGNLARHLQLS